MSFLRRAGNPPEKVDLGRDTERRRTSEHGLVLTIAPQHHLRTHSATVKERERVQQVIDAFCPAEASEQEEFVGRSPVPGRSGVGDHDGVVDHLNPGRGNEELEPASGGLAEHYHVLRSPDDVAN